MKSKYQIHTLSVSVRRIIQRNPALFIVLFLLFYSSCKNRQATSIDEIQQTFTHIPDTVQTSVYWYWMSGNISKKGVIKDLQSMKKAGINRAFIGNIGYKATPYGKVKIFSEEWWDIMHTALKTATQLNIQIGIFNSPGWSQSGGPWVKPNQAMRYLASSETTITGPKTIRLKLQKPGADFTDVNVLAFPSAQNKTEFKPLVSSLPAMDSVSRLTDKDTLTGISIDTNKNLTLDFTWQKELAANSLVLYPAHRRVKAKVEVQAEENGHFRLIKSFAFDRSNDALNVGFNRYAPVIVNLPSVKASHFRLLFTDASAGFGLTEVLLSPEQKVEFYAEKSLAKMYPTPFPLWDAYLWPKASEVKAAAVQPGMVKDISQNMDGTGLLTWDVPPGNWTIMRNGMAPTGVTNGPASPEGTGLEIDKMNSQHLQSHFDAFLGQILKRIPAEDRKTWKVVVQDSYETGGQNWTDGFIEKFKKDFGYDPKPYIPVLQGHVVGSADKSDRFLWDLRRFVADKVSYEYVGGLRKISHKNGLTTWLENYGHWGFPGEFLQYGGQSDEIGGEFWSEGDLGNIENRAASSSAHIYGRNRVSAESFTAGGKSYGRYPAMMKQRGDRFFTEGINNTLLHVYIEQPYEDKWPGVNADFSNEFNRHNTWFPYMDLFTSYLKRCNYMLQQGRYVADVAYFIGEDVPKMTGTRDPEIPQGYSYDYINAEVLQTRIKVEDGRLVLPDGLSYRILVLPKLETMRPELLQRIKELVKQGAVVMGPAPKRSPSLADYGKADIDLQKLAAELWGNINGKKVKTHAFGKGLVINGMTMQQALDYVKAAPDFKLPVSDSTLFIHRKMDDGELYFLSNQKNKTVQINPQFYIDKMSPELWDPMTGNVRSLPEFTAKNGFTSLPLQLKAYESAFIIFRKKGKEPVKSGFKNFPEPQLLQTLNGPWMVKFQSDTIRRGPAKPVVFNQLTDWTLRPEKNIRYYSGIASYTKTFEQKDWPKKALVYLDLGKISAMTKVKINGKYAGGVWTAPWRLDVTPWLKPGKNTVQIDVVNNWMNRLIGDLNLPPAERKTWTNVFTYKVDSPLQPSGLLGPVTLQAITYE